MSLPPPYQLAITDERGYDLLAWDTGRAMYARIGTITDADHAVDVVMGLELLRLRRLHGDVDPDLDPAVEARSALAAAQGRDVTISEGEGAERRLVRNSALCANCGDEIESTHRHDWVQCRCGSIYVDGGREYLRRGAADPSDLIDTSIWEEPGATPEKPGQAA